MSLVREQKVQGELLALFDRLDSNEFQWMIKEYLAQHSDKMCELVASRAKFDLLDFLVQGGFPLSANVLSAAITASAPPEVIEKLITVHHCPVSAECIMSAIATNNFEMAKFLRRLNCPVDSRCFDVAAGWGNMEILEWLKTEGCPWDGNALIRAARYGHLEVLKWLKANNCPFDPFPLSDLVVFAAISGSVPLVEWVLAQPEIASVLTDDVIRKAIRNCGQMVQQILSSRLMS